MKVISALVPKQLVIREEDYWILAVNSIAAVLVAATIYASVLVYRLPLLTLSGLLLWFTSTKIRNGYGNEAAVWHLAVVFTLGVALFVALFALTN